MPEPGKQSPRSAPTQPPDASPSSPGRPRKSGLAALKSVPLPVIVGALIVGVLAVKIASLVLTPNPVPPTRGPVAARADTVAPGDTALDIRWRRGRMEAKDCIATFEVTQGGGTPAQFTAAVMDSSGAIMARDSARVPSVVRGLLVDFRFRRVDCGKIADWQLAASTPTRTN